MHCRSREGAWIEMEKRYPAEVYDLVAPVRERGLKFNKGGEENEII